MSDDKLSEEEMREEIKNLISWGHAHDYDDIIKEARANAWAEGWRNGLDLERGDFNALSIDENPYRKQEEA